MSLHHHILLSGDAFLNLTRPVLISAVALRLFMALTKNDSLGSVVSKRLVCVVLCVFCSVFSAGGGHRCRSLRLLCQRHAGALLDAGRPHQGLHQDVQRLVEGSRRRQGRLETAAVQADTFLVWKLEPRE